MFSKVKNYIIAFFGALSAFLFMRLKYEKYKRNKVETELEHQKEQNKADVFDAKSDEMIKNIEVKDLELENEIKKVKNEKDSNNNGFSTIEL